MGDNQYPPQPSLIIDGATHEAHSQNIRRAAFTLAEVLITLGIIGVVAALTIPTLIAKHQKKVFATRVKQTYSIVSNAFLSSVADNGYPDTWNFGEKVVNDGNTTLNDPDHVEKMMDTYFVPYLKIINRGRINNAPYIILSNGTSLTFGTDGSTVNNIYSPGSFRIIASFKKIGTLDYTLDPDYSRDSVVLNIGKNDKKVGFFDWRTQGTDTNRPKRDILRDDPTYGCNKNVRREFRWNCGALIQLDNWEIKDDYPWH